MEFIPNSIRGDHNYTLQIVQLKPVECWNVAMRATGWRRRAWSAECTYKWTELECPTPTKNERLHKRIDLEQRTRELR